MRPRSSWPILLMAVWPAMAAAQAPSYPPGVMARGVALNAACRAAGGQAVNGPRPFLVIQHDLTGDRRADYILDEGAFACSSRTFKPGTPAGAPIEVFDGATGTSLYRGVAATWQVLAGARPHVMLTLRGSVCGPNALATTTCQRPMVWNPRSRTLTGPQGPLNRGGEVAQQVARPPEAPPSPASAPTSGLALSEAGKAAVLRAAGFKSSGRVWRRCEEETPTASYQPGAVEEVLDLNGDGRPEVVVTESSLFCYGNTAESFVLLTKGAGGWRVLLDEVGIPNVLKTKRGGWPDIEVGGPGFGKFPVYRWDGKSYVRRK